MVDGRKLKEIGTVHWNSPNAGATNESGFTALPGGARADNGTYNLLGITGPLWSTSSGDDTHAFYRLLTYNTYNVFWYGDYKTSGKSVRCVKDNATSARFIEYKDQITIYPNPTKGDLIIELPGKIETNVLIYTIAGKQIYSQKIHHFTNTLNVNELHRGAYLLKIHNMKYMKTEKLVIE